MEQEDQSAIYQEIVENVRQYSSAWLRQARNDYVEWGPEFVADAIDEELQRRMDERVVG